MRFGSDTARHPNKLKYLYDMSRQMKNQKRRGRADYAFHVVGSAMCERICGNPEALLKRVEWEQHGNWVSDSWVDHSKSRSMAEPFFTECRGISSALGDLSCTQPRPEL